MAASINIETLLKFNDSQFNAVSKNVEKTLRKLSTTETFVKLKLDDKDFRNQYQKQIRDLEKGVYKAFGKKTGESITYNNAKGNVVDLNSLPSLKKAYDYATERVNNKALSESDRRMWAARGNALGQYLNLIHEYSNALTIARRQEKKMQEMPSRLANARETARVAFEKRQAYQSLIAPEKEQKQADELFRRRYSAFAQEQTKYENEQLKRVQQLQREADKRAVAARIGYDKSIENYASGRTNSNDQLQRMRQYYAQEEKISAKNAKQQKQANDEYEREQKRIAQEQKKNSNEQKRIAREQERNSQKRISQLRQENAMLGQQSGLLGRLRSQLGMFFNLYGLIRFGQKIVETTGYFEQQRVALEAITKSAASANKLMNEIKDFALHSPLQTKDLINFTKKLSAFSVPTDQLFDTTKKLADLSVGLGVDMNRIVLAYGQVRSAAVLRGQELRQFTEAGIPMVEKLRAKLEELRGTTVSAGEVFEAISKRQVSFKMVDEVLTDMTSEGGKFYKIQEKINETLYGQVQKTKDVWTLAFEEIGKSGQGFLMNIVKGAQGVAKHIREILGIMTGAILGKALGGITTGVLRLVNFIKIIKLQTKSLAFITSQFKLALAPILTIFAAAVGYFVSLGRKANEFNKKIEEINESTAKNTREMSSGLSVLISKMERLAKAGNTASKEFKELYSRLKQNYGEFISEDMLQDFISDEAIAKLKKEEQGVDAIAKAYHRLEQAIDGAIIAKNNYLNIEQKDQLAADEVGKIISKLKGSLFGGMLGNTTLDEILYSGKREYIGIGASKRLETYEEAASRYYNLSKLGFDKKSFEQTVSTSLSSAWSLFVNKDVNSENAESVFRDLFESALIDNIPSFGNAKYAGQRETIVSGAWSKLSGTQEYQKWFEYNKELQERPEEIIKRTFENVTPNKTLGNGLNAADFNIQKQGLYLKALKDLNDEMFSNNEAIKDAKGYVEFVAGLNDAIEKIENKKDGYTSVLDSVVKLFSAITPEGEGSTIARSYLTQTKSEMLKYVTPLSGRAAITQQRALEHNEWSIDKDYMELFATFVTNITNETYEALRDQLAKKHSELEGELKKYKEGDPKDKPFIDAIKKQIKMVEELADPKMYAVDLSAKKKSGSGRGGWRAFMSDLFKVILDARKKETSLVESTTGYTNALPATISQLEKDILKDFYDGKPFDSIFDKITEYAVESKMLNADDIKELKTIKASMYENVGPDGIKTINYEDLWNKLLAFLAKKANTLAAGGDAMGADDIRVFAQGKITEGQMTFGRDEIQATIEKGLRELTKIETDLSKITNARSMYDRLSKISNTTSAYKTIYGTGYQSYDERTPILNSLNGAINANASLGLMSTNPMQKLQSIIKGGEVNISNLSMLMQIVADMNEQIKSSEIQGLDNQVRKQWEDTTKVISGIVQQLIESVVKEYEKEAATWTNSRVAGNRIKSAFDKFNDELELIDKNNSNGYDYERQRIEALTRFYSTAFSSVGVQGIPEWASRLYGYNGKGMAMSSIFNGFDMTQLKAYNEMYNAERNGGTEEDYKLAAESVLNFAAQVNLASAILSTLDKSIQAVCDTMNKYYDLMESQNGAVKDEYGNWTKANDYTKERMIVSTISEFSSDIFGIQKLLSGDIIGAILSPVNAVMDLIKNINNLVDQDKKEEQDRMLSALESAEKSMNRLQESMKDTYGNDKFDNYQAQKANLLQQQAYLESLIAIEKEMKNQDPEKLKGWEESLKNIKDQYADLDRTILVDLVQEANTVGQKLSDAFVNAFKNGENAARAWRDAVKGYIGEILANVLITAPIQKSVANIMKELGLENLGAEEVFQKFADPKFAKGFEKRLMALFESTEDGFSSLSEIIKEFIAYNSSSQSLGGTLEGQTEDTGRRIEGQANAILAQNVLTNNILGSIASSAFAQVQKSWFDETIENQRTIRDAVKNIYTSISDMRNNIEPLYVRMV